MKQVYEKWLKPITLILTTIGVSRITVHSFYDGFVVNGDNTAFFLYSQSLFEKVIYLWNETNAIGSMYTGVQEAPWFWINGVLASFFSYKIHYLMMMCAIYCGVWWSVYYFSNIIQNKISKTSSWYISFLSAWFYFLNYNFLNVSFDSGQMKQMLPFIFFPLVISFLYQFVDRKKIIYLLGLIISIFFTIQNIGHLIVLFLLVIIFLGFDFLQENFIRTKLKRYFLAGISSIISLGFVLLPNISFYQSSYEEIKDNSYIQNTTIDAEYQQQAMYFSLLSSFTNQINTTFYNNTDFYPIKFNSIFLLFPLFLVISLLFISQNHKPSCYLILLYLGLAFMMKGAADPYGELFTSFVDNFPGGAVFRSVTYKLNYIYLLLQVVIFIYIAQYFIKHVNEKKYQIIGFIIILIVILYPSVDFLSRLASPKIKVSLDPEYIKGIEQFTQLENQGIISRGLILPDTKTQWAGQTDFGLRSYSFFSQATNSIGFIDQGTATSNKVSQEMYDKLLKDYTGKDLKKLYSSLGIDFVVRQKRFQLDRVGSYANTDSIEFDRERFTKLRNQSIVLLDNKYFTVLGLNPIQKTLFEIEVKTIEKKINPTKYYLNVEVPSNQKKIILSFNQAYHPGWQLFPGRVIDSKGCSQIVVITGTQIQKCNTSQYQFFDRGSLKKSQLHVGEKILNPKKGEKNSRVIDLQAKTGESTYLEKGLTQGRIVRGNNGNYIMLLELYFVPQTGLYWGILLSSGVLVCLILGSIQTLNYIIKKPKNVDVQKSH